MGRTGSVVVGVDGSASGCDAVDWAAAEAATRHRPLRIVHAYTAPLPWDPFGVVSLGHDDCGPTRSAAQVLDTAVRRVRAVASDIEVTTRLVRGATVPAILAQTEETDLLVLGSRGLGGLRGLLAGSVSGRVITRAACPVVLVRPYRTVAPGPSAARVVVGVVGFAQSTRAIEFAVHAAAQRGVGVTAVHAWTPPGPVDFSTVADDVSAAEGIERRALEEALTEWRDGFAGVDITARLVRGRPDEVLVAESAGAALVVIGSRGLGGVRGALLGSVSQGVVRRASGPVAVVRPRHESPLGTFL